MNELYAFSYAGWFLIGISMGLGPCMLHHGLIVIPFIGMTRKNIRQALREFFSFHLVRLFTYSLLGALGGAVGYQLYKLVTRRFFILLMQGILGFFLMGLAIFVLFKGKNIFCRWHQKHLIDSPGKAMIIAGFFTALSPCPALLGLLAYTAASQRIGYGALAGLCFAAGTVFSPVLLAVPLWGIIKKRFSSGKIQDVFLLLNAFLFFAFGFHLLFSAWLAR